MKIYAFAPISACEYPTIRLLDHPYIWGGVQYSLNVSEKPYSPELKAAMASHGIEWGFCSVSEEEGAEWWGSLWCGMIMLDKAYKAGKKIVVHCDGGNNRSRSFVEAFHYMITGEQLKDEYKGEYNHLEYNCKVGHLPSIYETERKIRDLWLNLNEEKVKTILKRMVHHRIETYYGVSSEPDEMGKEGGGKENNEE